METLLLKVSGKNCYENFLCSYESSSEAHVSFPTNAGREIQPSGLHTVFSLSVSERGVDICIRICILCTDLKG